MPVRRWASGETGPRGCLPRWIWEPGGLGSVRLPCKQVGGDVNHGGVGGVAVHLAVTPQGLETRRVWLKPVSTGFPSPA